MIIVLILTVSIIVYGIFEYQIYRKRRDSILHRIHVNGIRGKSSTARLIASVLRESGLKTIGKTTGSAPRVIHFDGEESEIKRMGPARIIEQKKIMTKAYKENAQAAVFECMAINPEMQFCSEDKLIRANIFVLTNIRKDHLDVLGENEDDIFNSLSLSFPENSIIVTSEKNYLPQIEKICRERNNKLITALKTDFTKELSEELPYTEFEENISCAVEVGKLLNIDEETIKKGILKVRPDVGATVVVKNNDNIFINGFAANDYQSTIDLWKRVNERVDLSGYSLSILLNNREDRFFRVEEMVKAVSELEADEILLIGSYKKISSKLLKSKNVENIRFINTWNRDFIKDIDEKSKNKVFFGLGNIKDSGIKIIDYFIENGELI